MVSATNSIRRPISLRRAASTPAKGIGRMQMQRRSIRGRGALECFQKLGDISFGLNKCLRILESKFF
jgi:hypothetical protein